MRAVLADALNTTKKTISLDLQGIVTDGNNQTHAKTSTNPKGSGRPRLPRT
jgi:hypothetical protein